MPKDAGSIPATSTERCSHKEHLRHHKTPVEGRLGGDFVVFKGRVQPCWDLLVKTRTLHIRPTEARARQNRPEGRFLTRSGAQPGGPVACLVESAFAYRSRASAQVPCLLFGWRFGGAGEL